MLQTTLCYLIRRDGAYLMLHRVKKDHDVNHDKWVGVGGKFEDGESPEECVLRETREETGLTLTQYAYRGLVTFVSDRWENEQMHLFTATDWTGEAIECDEGVLEWISPEALSALPQWEGDRIFFSLLRENTPFFSLKLTYEGDKLTDALLNGKPYRDSAPHQTPLLVSACLLGTACRYDGAAKPSEAVMELCRTRTVIPVCPEILGGLPTPRPAAEIRGKTVISTAGTDVTEQYQRGAVEAVRLASLLGCRTAILKENSPSCGSGTIHNGQFDGGLTDGWGVAAAALRAAGITVWGESQIEKMREAEE
jgi:8-oxo-dGTP diphosphatase